MVSSVRGIIINMMYLVKKFGYVLNGSRVYYTKRSQPPLLIKMVDTYYTLTNDSSFVFKHMKVWLFL